MNLDGFKLKYNFINAEQWDIKEYSNGEFRLEIYFDNITIYKKLPCYYSRESLSKYYGLPF